MAKEHLILTFDFPDAETADQAFAEVKHLPGTHQAARVERDAEGLLQLREGWVHDAGAPTVGVGIAGGLIGLVGGPLGALIGWVAGTMIAGYAEDVAYRHAAEALTVLAVDLPEHAQAVLAEVREEDRGPADQLAAKYGATLTRRPADEVKAGVEAAERQAEQQADEGAAGRPGEDADAPAAGQSAGEAATGATAAGQSPAEAPAGATEQPDPQSGRGPDADR
ncbi:histidine kinase [Phaeacidiphilus oryzae]|uniref:histidine kinase n=1 Tax=Phaeacidiphilus oryzae TaxID=348818 RepID=UPI00126A067E|nr:histidine kinase [Phaeacidiphilus oryzae]